MERKLELNLWQLFKIVHNLCVFTQDIVKFRKKTTLRSNIVYIFMNKSEKRSQSVVELDDIVEAFNALDALDKLPTMYCEANDLLKLPPITLDPVSEQLLDNRKSLDNLDNLVKTLQVHLSSTRTSLSKERATVKGQIATLHRSPPPLASDQPHTQSGTTLPVNLLRSSNTNTQHHSFQSLRDSERHTNLIALFGDEETSSLSYTKALADEILEFVAGRPVSIGDLVRLGRPKRQPDADPSACCPRPVLV